MGEIVFGAGPWTAADSHWTGEPRGGSSRGSLLTGDSARHDSVESLIGDTPLYRCRHITRGDGPTVYLKMEQFNPGGSIKDRTALGILRHAERSGTLVRGMRIVESSSGNTAIGLAMLAKDRGYAVTAVCDRHLPGPKRARLRALGADIVFLPPTPVGMDTVELRIALADRLAEALPTTTTLGQYSNRGNTEIHYQATGPEIWRDVGDRLRAVVVATGTCGTISGVGRYLKEQNPAIRVIGVEPKGSVIFGGPAGRYLVQGGGLSFVPSLFDATVVDEGCKIDDQEAFSCVWEVARHEGWLLGGTAGLVVAGLKRAAVGLGPDDVIVGIVPDGGERYMDSIYDESWLRNSGMTPPAADDDFGDGVADAVGGLGCSVNGADAGPAISLVELCRRIGCDPPEA